MNEGELVPPPGPGSKNEDSGGGSGLTTAAAITGLSASISHALTPPGGRVVASNATNIHVSFRRCVREGGGGQAMDSFPVQIAKAKDMTLKDLCENVGGNSGVWDRNRQWDELWLVVLRDGFDQKLSSVEGTGGGVLNSLDVPYGRLAEYKLGDLVADNLVSLSAGSKVCLEVEYRTKVTSGFCTFGMEA